MLDIWRARLRALVQPRAMNAELDEELRYHLDAETARNVARGMSPDEAALAARRAFGNATQLKEEIRDGWGRRGLERLAADTRYAWRSFRRAPTFAATVIATIALGLGLNTMAFTIFNAYVLRPLAVRDPASLYQITWRDRRGDEHGFTWHEYEELRGARDAFSEIHALRSIFTRIDSAPAFGLLVSGNYFSMLGVGALLGRTLVPADAAQPGGAPVVVLSYGAWQRLFGSDSSIIGKTIGIRGHSVQVIGVVVPSFAGLGDYPLDFWAPATMSDVLLDDQSAFGERESDNFWLVGRLRVGVSERQADGWLTSWLRFHRADAAGGDAPATVTMVSRETGIALSQEFVLFFAPIATAFALVLLIACANVANMMLARGLARQRELGIRLSLGASRRRLIVQLLTEAIFLAVPAALAGFAISRITLDSGRRLMFATLPTEIASYMRIVPLSPDLRVFCFMLVAAIVAALLFGLAPALQATRPNIVQATRGDFDAGLRPSRLRNGLIVGQVTICAVLLVCAGILFRGVGRMQRLDIGMRTHGVVRLDLEERPGVRDRVLEVLRRRPDVRLLAAASDPPFGRRFPTVLAGAAGGAARATFYDFVTSSYFPLLEIPVRRGRTFTRNEERTGAAVVIISEGTAHAFWPGRDPIGETLRLTLDTTAASWRQFRSLGEARVIGVVPNVVLGTVIEPLDAPIAYYPIAAASAHPILVRVSGQQAVAARQIDSELSRRVPAAVEDIHTLDDYMFTGIYPFRAAYFIAGALGGIALLLTVTGVYGVLSYLVAQRRKELGIRMALGATPSGLVGLVLAQSLRLCAIGLAAGLLLALGVARIFAANIVRLDTYEPAAFAGAAGLVVLSCLAAAYAPSRRAARTDPIGALRDG